MIWRFFFDCLEFASDNGKTRRGDLWHLILSPLSLFFIHPIHSTLNLFHTARSFKYSRTLCVFSDFNLSSQLLSMLYMHMSLPCEKKLRDIGWNFRLLRRYGIGCRKSNSHRPVNKFNILSEVQNPRQNSSFLHPVIVLTSRTDMPYSIFHICKVAAAQYRIL